MELRFGGLWLLLTCSLQQSLWGILASVPQTSAKRCTQTVRVEGEGLKKVQIFKRIPSPCSGWDKAWSWITKVDCGTKYVWDYVELPDSVVTYKMQYVCCPDDGECLEAEANSSKSSDLNTTDETLNFAIAFGSSAVALLILTVIIIISLARKRRCGNMCGHGTEYTSANGAESVHVEGHVCNDYVDEGLKLVESEYEEIRDPVVNQEKKPVDDNQDTAAQLPYENVAEQNMSSFNGSFGNGVPVVPSAPYEEDLDETEMKHVCHVDSSSPSVVTGRHLMAEDTMLSCDDTYGEDNSENNKPNSNGVTNLENLKFSETEESVMCGEETRAEENIYSKLDSFPGSTLESQQATVDSLSCVNSSSYEHLDPNTLEPPIIQDYESLHYITSAEVSDQPPTTSSNALNSSPSCDSDLLCSNGETCSDTPQQSHIHVADKNSTRSGQKC